MTTTNSTIIAGTVSTASIIMINTIPQILHTANHMLQLLCILKSQHKLFAINVAEVAT